MAALHRPVGDDIAEVYGPYKSRKDLRKLKIGDKLDMLCTDGLNYHVEIKELEDDRTARIHFMYWGKKYDYLGPIDTLYLAEMGKYSEGISAQNTYPTMAKSADDEEKSNKKSSSSHTLNSTNKTEVQKPSYTEGQRYPEDFLSKPRSKPSQTRKRSNDEEQMDDNGGPSRKRRSDAAAAALDGGSSGGDDDSPGVKVEADPPVVVFDDSNGTGGSEEEASTDNKPHRAPVVPVGSHHRLLAPGVLDTTSNTAVPHRVVSSSSDAAYRSALDAIISTEETANRRLTILNGLRVVIGSETSLRETKKALVLIAKYPSFFENGDDGQSTNGSVKKTQYTLTMLKELLLARQQIDEVVSEILVSLS